MIAAVFGPVVSVLSDVAAVTSGHLPLLILTGLTVTAAIRFPTAEQESHDHR